MVERLDLKLAYILFVPSKQSPHAILYLNPVGLGPEGLDRGHKIHDAAACIDEGILDVADALDHEQAFLLGIDGLMVLVFQDGCIGANSHVQVAILGRLSEKLHMPAVQQVITSGYKYFLGHWLVVIGCCIFYIFALSGLMLNC